MLSCSVITPLYGKERRAWNIEAKKPVLCFLKTSRLRLTFCCRELHTIAQDTFCAVDLL